MPILPIDIQTMLGQMNEIGRINRNEQEAARIQQNQQAANVQQQSIIDDSKVHTVPKTENDDIKVKERESKRNRFRLKTRKQEKQESETAKLSISDPYKGKLIDIKK